MGGGTGHVNFYDRRKNLWICDTTESKEIIPVILDIKHSEPSAFGSLPRAVYTHHFDFSGTRMFIGGGPLLNGFMGCYAALWV